MSNGFQISKFLRKLCQIIKDFKKKLLTPRDVDGARNVVLAKPWEPGNKTRFQSSERKETNESNMTSEGEE